MLKARHRRRSLAAVSIDRDTKEFLAPKSERSILLKGEWILFARLVKGPTETEDIKKEIGFLPVALEEPEDELPGRLRA